MNFCGNCNKEAACKCSRCKAVFYCSRECQVEAWSWEHKFRCATMVATKEKEENDVPLTTIINNNSKTKKKTKINRSKLSNDVFNEPKYNLCDVDVGKLMFWPSSPSKFFNNHQFSKYLTLKNNNNNNNNSNNLLERSLHFNPPSPLINMKLENICFINSVLVILCDTTPLVLYCIQGLHSSQCSFGIKDQCVLCHLEAHVCSSLINGQMRPMSPTFFSKNLNLVAKHFIESYQQDAHEYFVHLLDSVEKVLLRELIDRIIAVQLEESLQSSSITQSEQEAEMLLKKKKKYIDFPQAAFKPADLSTSLVNKIFGGFFQSEVSCRECGYASRSWDGFTNISLDVIIPDNYQNNNPYPLEELLRAYCCPQQLDEYRCDCCNEKVRARKQVTIYKLPNILVIHLKRSAMFAAKNRALIRYPMKLNMSSFTTRNDFGIARTSVDTLNSDANNVKNNNVGNDDEEYYSLYGIICHLGTTAFFGHYVCIIKSSLDDRWFLYDDENVKEIIDLNQILGCMSSVYMLFYQKTIPNAQISSTVPFLPSLPSSPCMSPSPSFSQIPQCNNNNNNNNNNQDATDQTPNYIITSKGVKIQLLPSIDVTSSVTVDLELEYKSIIIEFKHTYKSPFTITIPDSVDISSMFSNTDLKVKYRRPSSTLFIPF